MHITAAVACPNQSNVAPSVIVAVDPKSFKVLDWKQINEMVPARSSPDTHFQGKDYAYLPGSSKIFRYEWNGKNLSLDNS